MSIGAKAGTERLSNAATSVLRFKKRRSRIRRHKDEPRKEEEGSEKSSVSDQEKIDSKERKTRLTDRLSRASSMEKDETKKSVEKEKEEIGEEEKGNEETRSNEKGNEETRSNEKGNDNEKGGLEKDSKKDAVGQKEGNEHKEKEYRSKSKGNVKVKGTVTGNVDKGTVTGKVGDKRTVTGTATENVDKGTVNKSSELKHNWGELIKRTKDSIEKNIEPKSEKETAKENHDPHGSKSGESEVFTPRICPPRPLSPRKQTILRNKSEAKKMETKDSEKVKLDSATEKLSHSLEPPQGKSSASKPDKNDPNKLLFTQQKRTLFTFSSSKILVYDEQLSDRNVTSGRLLSHGCFEIFQLHNGDVTYISCGPSFIYPLLPKLKLLRISFNQFILPLSNPERYWKIFINTAEEEVIASLERAVEKIVQYRNFLKEEREEEEFVDCRDVIEEEKATTIESRDEGKEKEKEKEKADIESRDEGKEKEEATADIESRDEGSKEKERLTAGSTIEAENEGNKSEVDSKISTEEPKTEENCEIEPKGSHECEAGSNDQKTHVKAKLESSKCDKSNKAESNEVESNKTESNKVESNKVESNLVESNKVESNKLVSNESHQPKPNDVPHSFHSVEAMPVEMSLGLDLALLPNPHIPESPPSAPMSPPMSPPMSYLDWPLNRKPSNLTNVACLEGRDEYCERPQRNENQYLYRKPEEKAFQNSWEKTWEKSWEKSWEKPWENPRDQKWGTRDQKSWDRARDKKSWEHSDNRDHSDKPRDKRDHSDRRDHSDKRESDKHRSDKRNIYSNHSDSSMDSLLDEYEEAISQSVVARSRQVSRQVSRQPSIASTSVLKRDKYHEGFPSTSLSEYNRIHNGPHRSRRSSRSDLYVPETNWMEPGRERIAKSRSFYASSDLNHTYENIYRSITSRSLGLPNGGKLGAEEVYRVIQKREKRLGFFGW